MSGVQQEVQVQQVAVREEVENLRHELSFLLNDHVIRFGDSSIFSFLKNWTGWEKRSPSREVYGVCNLVTELIVCCVENGVLRSDPVD